MIKIYNAKDQIEANRLMAFLQAEEIACYTSESGSGEYMHITMGYSVFGVDIYVKEEDAVRAKEIITELLEEDNSYSDESEIEEEIDAISAEEREIQSDEDEAPVEESCTRANEKDENVPWYKNQRIIGKIIVLIIALSLICKGIIELLMNN